MKIALAGTGNVAKRNYIPCLAAEFGGEVFDSIFVLTRETDRRDLLSALLDLNPRRLFCEKPLVAQNGQEDVREDDFAAARDLLQRAKAQGCETAITARSKISPASSTTPAGATPSTSSTTSPALSSSLPRSRAHRSAARKWPPATSPPPSAPPETPPAP